MTKGSGRKALPSASSASHLLVHADVIVGFPGETDADFEETLRVYREADFDPAFTFIYSPRAGTEAAGAGARSPASTAAVSSPISGARRPTSRAYDSASRASRA